MPANKGVNFTFRKFQFLPNLRVSQGVLGNKGTLGKYRREQGSMSLFLGNRGTKLYKLEDENMVSKFIKREQIRKTCGNMGT